MQVTHGCGTPESHHPAHRRRMVPWERPGRTVLCGVGRTEWRERPVAGGIGFYLFLNCQLEEIETHLGHGLLGVPVGTILIR